MHKLIHVGLKNIWVFHGYRTKTHINHSIY